MRTASLPTEDNNQRPHRTRARLFDAVEALLGQRDDLDPTLREITTAAGANVAAVNYHFGSKDALVTAVIERILNEHARQQLHALQAVDGASKANIEDIVRAWISPSVLTTNDDGTALIPRIAAHVVTGGSPHLRELGVSTHTETHALFFRLLADRLPVLSTEELTFRITLAAIAVVGMIVGPFEHSPIADNPPVRRDENTLDRTVGFIVAGLSAPPTPPPKARRGSHNRQTGRSRARSADAAGK
jgi:AcrR family transcriptional regulator